MIENKGVESLATETLKYHIVCFKLPTSANTFFLLVVVIVVVVVVVVVVLVVVVFVVLEEVCTSIGKLCKNQA